MPSGAPQLSHVGVPATEATLTPTVQGMRRLVLLVVVLGLAACGGGGDDDNGDVAAPTSPVLASESVALTTEPDAGITMSTNAAAGVVPEGFTQTAAVVTRADGTPCELCLWVADTSEERARGLMAVTDLGGADGMAFVYTEPTTGAFWMKDTVMPLTIGWFGADGAFVSASDMPPCTETNSALCARYAPAGPYTTAVEVPAGRLAELGIGPGSRLQLLTATCP